MKKAQPKSKLKSSRGRISAKKIAELQETLLKGVLLGQSLPGSKTPLRFPDLSFILKQPAVLLLGENLAGPISLKGAPKPVKVVSADTLRQEARARGELAFLSFQPAQVGADEVELTLDGRMFPRDPGQGQLGLSSVHVKFRKVKGKWRAVQEPAFSAA